MKIIESQEPTAAILFMLPTNQDEANIIAEFARIDRPLTATVKKGQGYKWLHLEIKKKIL